MFVQGECKQYAISILQFLIKYVYHKRYTVVVREMQRTIYVNSANRDAGGTDDDFVVTRTADFTGVPTKAKLVSASIPFTWGNVTDDNNTFTVTETTVGSDDFVISSGYYNGEALATAVQDLLNNSGVLTSTFTVTYDSDTLGFTITSSLNTFQIIFDASGSAAALLGFTAGTTNPGAPALSVTSTGTAALLPDYEVFLCSDLVTGSDNGVMLWSPTYTPTVSTQSQIMARIPITSCYSGVINYCASSDLPSYGITQSSFARAVALGEPASIRFFLTLPSGLPIDLNGYHWSAEIVLYF